MTIVIGMTCLQSLMQKNTTMFISLLLTLAQHPFPLATHSFKVPHKLDGLFISDFRHSSPRAPFKPSY